MTRVRHRILRGMLAGALACGLGMSLGTGTHGADAAVPYSVIKNVPYCSLSGVSEQADIYYPTVLPSQPMPLVLYFHGGTDGNYKGDILSALPHVQSTQLNTLISAGYEVISLNWPSASANLYPDAFTYEFAKCAVRTVRANATALDIDPHRIAAWGESNGGQIATILGTTTTSQGWDVGPYLTTSSRVEAVINWSDAGGAYQYVSHGAAPELIQVGMADSDYQWAQWFYGLFQKAGVPAQLQSIQNAVHQFLPVINPSTGLPETINPSPAGIAQTVVNFLNTYVKYNSNPQPQ